MRFNQPIHVKATPSTWWLVLALGVSYLLLFPKVWLGTQTFFLRDYSAYELPVCAYVKTALLSGQLPLWDPYNSLGIPLLGQWAPMVLYPATLIYILLPIPFGVNLFMFAHLLFAGVGMFYLCRFLFKDPKIAFIIGYAFGLNGCTLSMLLWPHIIATYSYVPWVCFTTLLACSRPGVRTIILGGITAGLQMLTGTPEIILITWMLVTSLFLSQQFRIWKFTLLAAMGLIGIVLACGELAPFFQMTSHSSRAFPPLSRTPGELTWGGILNVISPSFMNPADPYGTFFQKGQSWIASFYLPLGLLVAAFAGLSRFKSKAELAYVLPLFGGLLLATGVGSNLPGLELIHFPVKFQFLPFFTCFLLAALFLTRSTISRRFLIVFFSFVLLCLCSLPLNASPINLITRVAMATLLVVAFKFRWSTLGIILILFLDIATQNPKTQLLMDTSLFNRTKLSVSIPALGEGRFAQDTSAFKYVHSATPSNPALATAVLNHTLAFDANLRNGASVLHGFFPLALAPAQAAEYATGIGGSHTYSNLLDFLDVKYCTADTELNPVTGGWVYRPGHMGMFTIGITPAFTDQFRQPSKPQSLDAYFAQRATIWATNNFHNRLLLPNSARGQGYGTTNAHILRTTIQPHCITLEADTDKPTFVTVAQACYPNWVAKVNGRVSPIYEANGVVQGIAVPAGKSYIKLEYVDNFSRIGGTISLLGWGTIVFLLFYSRKQQ